ncbi:DNA (cytosine-5-)-methyltransferase, partial [Mesomycoplasma hyopneumoniae]
MKYYKISEIAKLESVSQKFIRKEIAKKSLISTKQNNKYLILDSHYQDWKLSYKKEASSNKKIGKIEEKVQFIDVLKEMNKLDGWNSNYKNGYKFIDLFSGAGGL